MLELSHCLVKLDWTESSLLGLQESPLQELLCPRLQESPLQESPLQESPLQELQELQEKEHKRNLTLLILISRTLLLLF